MDYAALISQIGLPLVAVLVPLIVAVVKKLLPQIPSMVLPIIALLLGPAMDFVISLLPGVESSSTVMAALAGLAGVGLREIKDQVGKAIADHRSA